MGASMVVTAKALTVGRHPPSLAIIREGAWRGPQRPMVRLAAYCWPRRPAVGGRRAEPHVSRAGLYWVR